MRVYYAHAICLYGTEHEKNELVLIRENFKNAEVINPVNYQNECKGTGDPMDFFLSLVDSCHIVVFSCLLGKITAGVGKEVNHALKKGKNVFMLKGLCLIQITSPVKYISRQNIIELYQEWQQRK